MWKSDRAEACRNEMQQQSMENRRAAPPFSALCIGRSQRNVEFRIV
jgi:hypothetical protein